MAKVSIEELRLVFRVLTEIANTTPVIYEGFRELQETRKQVALWIIQKEQARG